MSLTERQKSKGGPTVEKKGDYGGRKALGSASVLRDRRPRFSADRGWEHEKASTSTTTNTTTSCSSSLCQFARRSLIGKAYRDSQNVDQRLGYEATVSTSLSLSSPFRWA